MRAASYARTGLAREVLEIGTLPDPVPAPGEVLVRVITSGLNPSDVKTRAGWMPMPLPVPRVVPHSDGAGVVEAVGEGISPARIGERVWLWNAQWERAFGTAAERIALPAEQAVPLPESVSFAEGATLGIPGRTGWVAAQWGRPGPGRRVLVQGTGAVGAVAIAVAATAGAEVLATASDAPRAALARAAGAAHVLPRGDGLTEQVMALTADQGVDHIVEVDLGANAAVDAAVLSRGGTIAAYSSTSAPRFELDYYAFARKAAAIRMVQVYLLDPEERRAAEEGLTALLSDGRLPLPIAAQLPLDRIAEAHEMQETGRPLGTIVLDIAEPKTDGAHP